MEPLFKIGDTVRDVLDGEKCTVLEIHVTADDVLYKVSSVEFDHQNREVIQGHKTMRQEELEAFTDETPAVEEPVAEEENAEEK